MKTFETEKNNIPEGATHYQEPDAQHVFAWFKLDGNKLSIKVPVLGEDSDWDECKLDYYKGRIKPIPKPKTTEWKDKDNVPPVGWCGLSSYTSEGCDDWCDFHDGVVMGVNGDHVWMAHHGKFQRVHHISEIEFKEPESPEEKEQRERLEAAYVLYSSWVSNTYGEPLFFFKDFCDTPDLCTNWLAIVDKTNYRNGE